MTTANKVSISLKSIGEAKITEESYQIVISKDFKDGLKELNQFSHVTVVWWADKEDNEKSRTTLRTKLPYANDREAGVFACRSEYRPNPIALTVCAILSIDEERGIISVPYFDGFDGTPILDLKPYFPVSDRVRDFRVPTWVQNWPEWYEDAYKLQELFADMMDKIE